TTSDRGHRPLVTVRERLRLLSGETSGDRLAGVLTGLEPDRPQLRKDLLRLLVRDRGDVADRVHLGMVLHGEVRSDADPVPALQVEPQRLHELVALEAR